MNMQRRALISLLSIGLLAMACTRNEARPAAANVRPPDTVTATAGQRVTIQVGEGYAPATVRAPAGANLTLVFLRNTDETCGQQVVFPSLNIRRDLPLNQPVEVPITVPASGSVNFTCSMNMYRGTVVAQ